ncbi:hypothetical protein NMY22_g5784 [Coprinellus aureogranulatus]|nr:hypothetical protein NMY22_g5784 [Coprinellus aureogranulatus]
MVHLEGEDLGGEWTRTVQSWVGLEALLGYGNIAKTPLPVQNRPEEWSKWASKTKNRVQPYDNLPKIEDPAEFGVTILRWWNTMQPSFRASDNNFPRSVYSDPAFEGDPWAPIRKSGPNGFVVLMTLICWWGRGLSKRNAFMEDSRPAWTLLVQDVRLCLEEMVKPIPEKGGKRERDENTEDPDACPSKRQKV